MRVPLLGLVFGLLATAATTAAGLGCNALLDIRDHAGPLATASEAGLNSEAGPASLPPYGALTTIGRAPDNPAMGTLPDGGRVTLTDDGFEPGGTVCNGAICVTGAITP